jgi:hypothetical protein
LDREFQYAVHSARKDKINFVNVGGNCLNIRDVTYKINKFCFYKVSDIFNEDTTIISTSAIAQVPKLRIPTPAIRRIPKFDNKFFLSQVRKAPTQGWRGTAAKFEKTAELYAPFLYFYFEETQFEENKGYITTVYPKYSSKLDRNITFVDYNTHFERENEELKNEAVELFTKIEDLKRKRDHLIDELQVRDPDGRIQKEFEEMRRKLKDAVTDDD